MVRKFTLLLLSMLFLDPRISVASDAALEQRVAWVQKLKGFMLELEKKSADHLLTVQEKIWLDRFKLFEEAWADSRHDCFFAGWPSTLVRSRGRRLCQSPSRGSATYEQGSCAAGQMQCQPLLFGEGLCVSFANVADKSRAFSKCESKFQNDRRGNYDFVKELNEQELYQLREISRLAVSICEEGSMGVQQNTPMCRNLLAKVQDAVEAIDEGALAAVGDEVVSDDDDTAEASSSSTGGQSSGADPQVPVPPASPDTSVTPDPPPEAHSHSEDCGHGLDVLGPEVEGQIEQIDDIISNPIDRIYHTMKAKFEASIHCNPHAVFNDPSSKPNGLLLGQAERELDFIGRFDQARIAEFVQRYQLPESAVAEVQSIFGRSGTSALSHPNIRAKAYLLQAIVEKYKATPDYMVAESKELLAQNRIFKREDGEVKCPFVGLDAFRKAMAGRERVLRSYRGSLTKSEQLTIVDYSRPSNERRLFVLDLSSQEVLHNTWVSHGHGGGTQSAGSDGYGSNPAMSNVPGTNLSSEGFIIARSASVGRFYGPNVLLRGIDSNNSRVSSRQIVLHGQGSPLETYSRGVRRWIASTDTFTTGQDVVTRLENLDPRTASIGQVDEAIQNLRNATKVSPYLGASEGCLGVPRTNVRHLDRRGRNKSQLELLREDLPGSLMFSYSGPSMKSKFF